MSSASVSSTRPNIGSFAEVRPINRAFVAHRVVQLGIFLTLVWKWTFFVAASKFYAAIPLQDSFFPAWLQSVVTVRIAFLAAIASVVINLVARKQRLRLACSAVALISTTVLCVHQASYNDMTFVTAWWACLWSMWFVHHLNDADQSRTLQRAAFLSRLIISVILLGGASGKWTAEYWSGEVFYDIYFVDRNYWVFNWLRSYFDPEQLRSIAMWYSRKVVVVETVAGLGLWALPPRIAAAASMTLLASIALLSNFLLFSVLFALIGLGSVGLLVPPSKATDKKKIEATT